MPYISGGGGGGAAQPAILAAARTYTETAGAGTYTATVALPAGAVLVDVDMETTAAWAATTAAWTISDTAGVIQDGQNAKTVGFQDLLNSGGTINYYGVWGYNNTAPMRAYPAGDTITCVITTTGAGGTTGRSRALVYYVVPGAATAATKA